MAASNLRAENYDIAAADRLKVMTSMSYCDKIISVNEGIFDVVYNSVKLNEVNRL